MSSVKIIVHFNHLPSAPGKMNKAIGDAMQTLAPQLLSTMQQQTPVDTGELRGSEQATAGAKELRLSASAGHAGYVEFGTKKWLPSHTFAQRSRVRLGKSDRPLLMQSVRSSGRTMTMSEHANSIYVFPGAPMYGFVDGSRPYAESICEILHRLASRVTVPNLAHLVGVQLHLRLRASSLRRHVLHVVRLGSQEEVIRPDAGRVVASMQHPQAIWDGAVVQLPTHAMGRDDAIPAIELAVAASGGSASPFPASVAFVDMTPEANVGRGEARGVVARWRAVTRFALANAPSLCKKGGAALETCTGVFATLAAHFSDLLDRSGSAVPRAFAAPLGVSILPKTAQPCGILTVSAAFG